MLTCLQRLEAEVSYLGAGVKSGCELPDTGAEPNSGSLNMQEALSAAAPSL